MSQMPPSLVRYLRASDLLCRGMVSIFRKLSSCHFIIQFLAVMFSGLYGLWPAVRAVCTAGVTDIVAGDSVDTGSIVAGLERVRSISDVLAWWYGPWVAGPDVAFYRPIPSTIWYIEYCLFGYNGYFAFQVVHFISHLLALLIAWFFFSYLVGRQTGTVCACLFALSLPYKLFGLPGTLFALPRWKDSPEFWFTIASLLSFWSFLRYLRGVGNQYKVYALIFFITAVMVKEMAYIVPLLLTLLLWHEKKFTVQWKSLFPFYIAATILFVFRFWALEGSGFRFGTNGAWMQRWIIHVVGGTPGASLVKDAYLPLAISCIPIALYALWKRAWREALVSATIMLACFVYTARQWSNADDPFYYQLIGSDTLYIDAFLTLLLIAAFCRFIVTRRRSQLFAWLWVVISYIPLMTAPITEHALYFVSLGWSLWFAYTIKDMQEALLYMEQKAKNRFLNGEAIA